MADAVENTPSSDDHVHWLAWHSKYTARLDVRSAVLPPRCPCCGCKTLDTRADYDICPVCFWEDDGQDDHDAGGVCGGPNGLLSLTAARANYLRLGACEASMVEHVRPPTPEELPGNDTITPAN